MSQEELQLLLSFFKILANETRLKILGLLSTEERSVGELAGLLRLKEPTISHHLSKMKALSLVLMKTEGNTHLYSLNEAALNGLKKDIFRPEKMQTFVEDVEVSSWEKKVLKTYFEDDKLKQIPASRKKRLVVLKYLIEFFDFNRQYSEKEVNHIIGQYHWDFATLRREMIADKLMERKNSVYWRI